MDPSIIPVACTEPSCGRSVPLPAAAHDDIQELKHLRCPAGHIFDFVKFRCPRCGSLVNPAEWRALQVGVGDSLPVARSLVFHPAHCTACDWEGPKS